MIQRESGRLPLWRLGSARKHTQIGIADYWDKYQKETLPAFALGRDISWWLAPGYIQHLAPLTIVPSMFLLAAMLKDRGDQLKYAIANALPSAARVVRGLRATLTVSQREDVAEAAVNELRTLPDDPWKLGEPLPKSWGVMSDLGASTSHDWCRSEPSKPDGE
jgi:hypothetical protein